MKESFVTSFKIKNTYLVNSILYSLKQLPIIKNILPNSLYNNNGLKALGIVISMLLEIGSVFIGKIIYMLLMILLPLSIYPSHSEAYLHIFVMLTITGGFLNTFMFNPSKDKYYAIILMNMDAKKYTLSNYYYSLLKVFIGFLPLTIIFGLFLNIPILISLIIPIFIVMVKISISNFYLIIYDKTNKINNENNKSSIGLLIGTLFFLLAYIPLIFNITINTETFIIIFIIVLILGIYSLYKINNFNKYKKMYKSILTSNNVFELNNKDNIVKTNVSNEIKYDNNNSNKKGYAFFHEIFVKRHRKILTDSIKIQTLVILLIFLITIIYVNINNSFNKEINKLLLTYLPYFVFIMYMLNRGTLYTQAMFMNCDHSMLTYRFFRTSKVILGLFKERLKTLIILNLVPSIIIAIGLPVLLYLTGGTNNIINYFVLFISIISMSIFFSIHYLIMYYLLQPYNVNIEMKSSTYKVVQGITYFVCYYMIQIKLPTLYFGLASIIFCILYSIISLFIVYKYAPKTFKLRN